MFKERGLTSEEAKKELQKQGFNEIHEISKTGPLRILLRQIRKNFVIYLLIFAMVLSFIVGKSLTGYVIAIVIVVVIFTGFLQEYKAEKAIQSLKKMLLPISVVIRDGREIEISSKEIVSGDVLVLRRGEKIPADCVIIDERDILVDESIITGESVEIKKYAVKNIKDYKEKNILFMGSFLVSGKCTAKVIHTGMDTKFGKIAGMISSAEKELPLQKKVNHIAKYMAVVGSIFAILTGLIILFRAPMISKDLMADVIIVVIAIAVSSFPEGFPVVLITSLATGSYRMANKNALVNRMSIIETLGETTVICSDKTGTITKGEMTVKKVFCDGKVLDISGIGYEGKGDFILNGRKIDIKNEKTLNLLLKTSLICNDSNISRTGEDSVYFSHGTPTEIALLILGAKAGLFKEDFSIDIEKEISFSSERKMMSILSNEKPKKIYSKGALEVLLEKCKYVQRDNGIFRLLERDRKSILKYNSELTLNAFRTLGLAYKIYDSKNKDLEEDLVFLGFVAIEDPAREEVKESIAICREAGIKVKMITGDNKETALSIARQIHLDSGKILEGKDLDELSDKELAKIVSKVSIFARVRPEHKLRIVKALKANGEIVTMTGDGVNDAPALKEAHIGVAMGKNGTDVSRAVADLVLKDDNFSTIVTAVKEGRTIFTNIQKFSTYQISVNFAQVFLIFLAILIGLPLPLVAIQILFMNLFSDELTAITLAFNPYSGDVMSAKPRRKSQIVTKPLFLMLLISGLIMSLGSLAVFYYTLTSGKSEIGARTVTFISMVFFGITNAFNYRSFRKLSLTRSPFSNKYLVFASIFVIFMTFVIIYSPLHFLLETTAVKLKYWIIAVAVSLSVLVVFDLLKWINKKKPIWGDDVQEFESSFFKRKNTK